MIKKMVPIPQKLCERLSETVESLCACSYGTHMGTVFPTPRFVMITLGFPLFFPIKKNESGKESREIIVSSSLPPQFFAQIFVTGLLFLCLNRLLFSSQDKSRAIKYESHQHLHPLTLPLHITRTKQILLYKYSHRKKENT